MVWFSVGVVGLVWRQAVTHKVVLSEDTVFELSDEAWNGLIEKGYITDEA